MTKYVLALIALLLSAVQTAYSQCTADAGPEFILTCVTTQATLQGSSNVPDAIYAWSGPGGFMSSEQNPVVVEAGNYSLTITDPSNNCTATALTGVFLNTQPPVVGLAGGVLTCNQPQVTITTTVTPFNCTFIWTGPAGFNSFQQNPTVNNPGNYTIIVTNPSNGCTTTQSVTINQDISIPQLSASGDSITCTKPTANLQASTTTPGAIFAWSGPGGYSSTQQNPSVSQTGNYTVTVTSALNGCTNTAVVTVTVDASVPVAMVTSNNISCFGLADGSINLTVSGGTPPYTYSWNNGITTQVVTNLTAGTYTATVTDFVGCTSISRTNITEPAAINVNAALITISPPTCTNQANGSIAIPNPTGGTPGYTYFWNGPAGFEGITKNIVNLVAGNYNLTITDSGGCTKNYSFTLQSPAPVVITNSYFCDNAVSVSAGGGTAPYDYIWRLGGPNGQVVATGPNPANLPLGSYTLIVSDNIGCTASFPYTISPNTTPCTRITGQITLDDNQNCTADTLEPGLTNWYLKAEGASGTFYGLSEPDGSYTVSLAPGNYTLSLLPQGYQPLICQNDIPVSLQQSGDSAQVDFLVQVPDPDCANLSIDLTAPLLRRCFNNNHYYVQVCNNGPAEVPDAYFTLQLDPFLVIQEAEIPFTNLGNNLFRFELGTLPPNSCDVFWVRVLVSCTAALGQTHCSEAHIYPDTLCGTPNPQWSGAQLEVTSECIGDSLHFIIKNIGAGNMTQVLDYIVIEDGIMSLQGSAPPLGAGQSMVVSVPANGATWRIETQQEAFSPVPNQPVLSVEGCSSTGSFTTGFVNQFPLSDNSQWIDVDCTPNTGSYDPNDKQGFPTGYGPEHYIRPGTELEYLIRFQNTGTDTAFQVVIRDTLSQWLDPLTVRAGVSSHPYQFILSGEGVLIFDFQNIMLPDSNTNEPASNGFVRFSIRPRNDVPLETDLLNSAAIYFDFNEPVLTNTTVHRLGDNFVTVGWWQPAKPIYEVLVAPHPVQEASWIEVRPTVSRPGKYTLQLYELTGRPVRREEAPEPRFLLKKAGLPAGIYLFKIENDGAILGSGKLIVR